MYDTNEAIASNQINCTLDLNSVC